MVEFLPYVLKGLLQGSWTRTVSAPTPCGATFVGTDLFHVGYPLDRSSVLHLEQACQGKLDWKCFKGRQKHSWDNRDFSVPPQAVIDIIDRLLVKNATNPLESCHEYNRVAGDDYVLYNVNCSNKPGLARSVHHFYREPDWIDVKTQSFSNAT